MDIASKIKRRLQHGQLPRLGDYLPSVIHTWLQQVFHFSNHTSLHSWMETVSHFYNRIPLYGVGLLPLADLGTVTQRTALTGTAYWLDTLVLVPGSHAQQDAHALHRGEYPACAAMTTGYVFRVENPATVFFLQRVGRTGHLTTLRVSDVRGVNSVWSRLLWAVSGVYDLRGGGSLIGTAAYFTAVGLAVAVLWTIVSWRDEAAVTFFGVLVLARLINVLVLRRRAAPTWFGYPEPGTRGDLLVLVSQDRWIRIQGLVTDLKAVTSGQWLREATSLESSFVNFATLLV